MSNDWVSQMVLLTFTILAGVATYLSTRHHKGSGEKPDTKPPPLLNGYATVLQRALDRAERLREENSMLKALLEDCQKRAIAALHDEPPPTTRRRTAPPRTTRKRTSRSE